MRRGSLVSLLFLTLVAVCAGGARGASISYQATDLPDTVPGQDLWQYQYSLSGTSLSAGEGFDVFFALADGYQFGDLVDPLTGPSGEWDVLAIQADPGLPADGIFDAVAIVNDPISTAPFTAAFIWRGTGTPGAQHFEIFDSSFTVTESGTTAPEPTATALVLVALASLIRRVRR